MGSVAAQMALCSPSSRTASSTPYALVRQTAAPLPLCPTPPPPFLPYWLNHVALMDLSSIHIHTYVIRAAPILDLHACPWGPGHVNTGGIQDCACRV